MIPWKTGRVSGSSHFAPWFTAWSAFSASSSPFHHLVPTHVADVVLCGVLGSHF